MSENKIRVKLTPVLEKNGQGFVDPVTGQTIAKGKYDKSGSILVVETPFVTGHITAGALIRADKEKKPEVEKVEVTFKVEKTFKKKKQAVGDKVKVTRPEAETLLQEDVIEPFESAQSNGE